jgi:6-phosphogluconolactonase
MSPTAVYVACAKAKRIDVFHLDLASGALVPAGSHQADHQVSCLALHPDRRTLYAALNSQPASVASFALGAGTGEPAPAGAGELAANMAYLSVDPSGRQLLAASYHDHLVTVSGIGDGGVAGGAPTAQETPGRHVHAVLPSPDGRFVYATALGDDCVVWWPLDAANGTLGGSGRIESRPGSGPRHLRFSPAGDRLYVLHEMAGDVTVYGRDSGTGALTEQQTVSSIPPELDLVPGKVRNGTGPEPGPNAIWCAELQFTPDGRFLYTTERSSSTISIFAVDQADGSLTLTGRVGTEKQPRGMNIDPTGQYLLAAGEESDRIAVYRIGHEDGALQQLGSYPCSAGPRWFEFVALA